MQSVMDAMFAELRPTAAGLLAAEQQPRAIFAASAASGTSVRAAVTAVERTRTEGHLIHLLAHLKTRELLSVEQRRLYHAARWDD